ncbi:hypothetical protein GCM10010358_43450 [Streptomyces minutiscleroticus]|uniref:Uncharacterized protein n=1 Tax=Streptomyces minutiscleroticus TaxID=68238 RepID=A0A918U2W6_9ACTN|nr:hypothetical protein GCM10010358_43450 [Streptomyces minutiscleroticus]
MNDTFREGLRERFLTVGGPMTGGHEASGPTVVAQALPVAAGGRTGPVPVRGTGGPAPGMRRAGAGRRSGAGRKPWGRRRPGDSVVREGQRRPTVGTVNVAGPAGRSTVYWRR